MPAQSKGLKISTSSWCVVAAAANVAARRRDVAHAEDPQHLLRRVHLIAGAMALTQSVRSNGDAS